MVVKRHDSIKSSSEGKVSKNICNQKEETNNENDEENQSDISAGKWHHRTSDNANVSAAAEIYNIFRRSVMSEKYGGKYVSKAMVILKRERKIYVDIVMYPWRQIISSKKIENISAERRK